MSIASGGNEIETAVVQHNASANVQDSPAKTLEASEDRIVHFVHMTQTGGADVTTEVSFSSQFELNSAGAQDEIASGVLHINRGSAAGIPVVYYDSAPPRWEAGEEINLHVNNTSGSEQQTRLVIGYEPIGDFDRDRLRNR